MPHSAISENSVRRAVEQAFERIEHTLATRAKSWAKLAFCVAASLEHHVTWVRNWALNGDAADHNGTTFRDRLVEPDVVLLRRARVTGARSFYTRVRRPLLEAVTEETTHIVLLGEPGCGKTTALRQLAIRAFESGSSQGSLGLPIFVNLRELSDADGANRPLEAALRALMACKGDSDAELDQDQFTALVDALELLVLIDGFDEIADAGTRSSVLNEFSRFVQRLRRTRLLLTSRPSSISHELPDVATFKLAHFSREQIHRYARHRLDTELHAARFLQQAESTPYAEALATPALLEQLCATVMRVGTIPSKPRSFYSNFIYRLLEEWDSHESVARRPKYERLGVDRRLHLLAHLAFGLTTRNATAFGKDELLLCIRDIAELYELSAGDAALIGDELVSQGALLALQSDDRYTFAHRCIAEYLCAEYLIRSPSLLYIESYLPQLPNELAVATSLANDSARYLSSLTFEYLMHQPWRTEFAAAYTRRLELEKPDLVVSEDLILALLCLSILVDSLRIFSALGLSTTTTEALRVATKYYYLSSSTRLPQLVAHSRHPRYRIPFSIQIDAGTASRLLMLEADQLRANDA